MAAQLVAAVVDGAPQTAEAPIAQQIDFTGHTPAPGSFPARWICGSPSCMDNTDPPVQVHWYNEHTVFMRQNKAYSYEAPFMRMKSGRTSMVCFPATSLADASASSISSGFICSSRS